MLGSIWRSRRGRLALGAAVVALAGAPAAWADWATWGNGSMRQGLATESVLTSKNAKTLKLAWSRPIGGTGAAQPLAISGLAVPGGRIYVAASESGRVSAFVAQTGQLLWKRELGSLLTGCSQLPKGRFGITGTPTYDTTTGILYVADLDNLYALDVKTGADVPGWPIELGMDPHYEVVWGAIAQRGTNIYVATASYCDRRPYAGRVIRVDTIPPAHRAEAWYSVEDIVPGGGGIWGWGGVAITPDGHVWAATANANAKDLNNDAHWNAESIVELSDHLGLLQVGHAKGMPIHGDYGFGSTPVVFTPKGCTALVAAEGKDGVLYVWQRASLGKGPIAADPARLPRHAVRPARVGQPHPAAVPDDEHRLPGDPVRPAGAAGRRAELPGAAHVHAPARPRPGLGADDRERRRRGGPRQRPRGDRPHDRRHADRDPGRLGLGLRPADGDRQRRRGDGLEGQAHGLPAAAPPPATGWKLPVRQEGRSTPGAAEASSAAAVGDAPRKHPGRPG